MDDRKAECRKVVDLGGTPVRTSIFSDPEMVKKNPTYPIILESLKRAANLVDAGIIWIPPNPKALKVLEIAGTYGNAVLEGQMSAEDAMNKAQAEAVDIMNQ